MDAYGKDPSVPSAHREGSFRLLSWESSQKVNKINKASLDVQGSTSKYRKQWCWYMQGKAGYSVARGKPGLAANGEATEKF